MMRWLMAASLALVWTSVAQQVAEQEADSAAQTAPTSQPATKPAGTERTFRKPAQVEILRALLQQKETPAGVMPWYPEGQGPDRGSGAGASDRTLLLEGTTLHERPGRYVRTDDRPRFSFYADDSGRAKQSMEILPNQYLEMMERAAKAGVTEFVISAQVTTYRGENYLLLYKVLRRVSNRNLAP